MNKRKAHHYWRYLRAVKPSYFLLAAAVCSVLSFAALRSNNQHMSELRQAVYTADENNGDVQSALTELQQYVTSHMNTSLATGQDAIYPPIQLEHTYDRLVAAQKAAEKNSNENLYTEAQAYCQKLNPTDFSGRNRVPCIQEYVQTHGSNEAPGVAIDPSLYQFDFVAPKWSPDFAGWSLVATILLVFLAVGKYALDRYMRKLL